MMFALQSHQNRFHIETIKTLTGKFANIKDYGNTTEAERELWRYFATLYKNSNKGIKGRGKDRRIANQPAQGGSPPTPAGLSTSTSTVPSQYSMHQQQPQQHGHQHQHPHHAPAVHNHSHAHPHPHGLPQLPLHNGGMPHHAHAHGLSHPAAYSMSRPNLMVNVHGPGRDASGNYEMYDVDEETVAASGTTSTTSATLYEEGRELAFGDRMY
jgi:hypothetical protein